jgi:hypothetical protein
MHPGPDPPRSSRAPVSRPSRSQWPNQGSSVRLGLIDPVGRLVIEADGPRLLLLLLAGAGGVEPAAAPEALFVLRLGGRLLALPPGAQLAVGLPQRPAQRYGRGPWLARLGLPLAQTGAPGKRPMFEPR